MGESQTARAQMVAAMENHPAHKKLHHLKPPDRCHVTEDRCPSAWMYTRTHVGTLARHHHVKRMVATEKRANEAKIFSLSLFVQLSNWNLA